VSVGLRVVLFLIGLGLATLIVAHVGPSVVLAQLVTAGWLMLPASIVWGIVYTFNAAASYTMLGLEPARPGFLRTWVITAASFGINYITPVAGLGGEGYRAFALVPWLGRQRAVGAVVQYRLLHSLAHMVFVLLALIPAAFMLPRTAPAIALLLLTALFGIGVGWFLVRRHHEGILEAGLDLLLLIPLIRRLGRRLEHKRPMLREMDDQITTLYHEHPGRFWRAFGLEFLSRCVMPFELVVLFWGLGLGIRIPEAFIAFALTTTVSNLLFFLPMELGAREGGLYLVFGLLGLGAEHGVFVAVVTRLRELVWGVMGLMMLWLHGDHVPRQEELEAGAQ